MSDKVCTKCNISYDLVDFHKRSSRNKGKGLSSWCRFCLNKNNKKYRQENKKTLAAKRKIYDKQYLKNNKHLRNARNTKRRAYKLNATPNWAELDKIKIVYEKVKWLESLTGLRYHVDHIVPLKGENVCGLHVWANLQILEFGINCSKGNSI